MAFTVRTMTRPEVDLAVEWAAQEGWNPGNHDADIFYNTDPNGFLVGLLDDEPIGCISVVSYGGMFGFLGFYIVKPEYRGKGYGHQIWQAGMERLKGHNIGLDGVVAQQENYKKSGFKLAYRNIRYGGIGCDDCMESETIVSLKDIPLEKILVYDIFPVPRPQFITEWVQHPDHYALGILEDDVLRGFGVLRPCRTGYKIGPLFADNRQIANVLCRTLRYHVPNDEVFLDVPEENVEAVVMAQRHGMTPVFETARMYTGDAPDTPLDKVFGVTTFELG